MACFNLEVPEPHTRAGLVGAPPAASFRSRSTWTGSPPTGTSATSGLTTLRFSDLTARFANIFLPYCVRECFSNDEIFGLCLLLLKSINVPSTKGALFSSYRLCSANS